ncbi:translation initiation factor IF-2, partial [Candidatus Woesearchaeota archaeon]
DINEGFKPQTSEALEILKQFKTPFVVAANKIDLIPGWVASNNWCELFKNQPQKVLDLLDKKIYELVGHLFEHGFQSERFDKLTDFTKQVAIVPVSAVTGQGIPQLLLVLVGLAQKFLTHKLKQGEEGLARGTVLEVKEATGMGLVLDAIIYSGNLHKNDTLVIGSISGPIQTRVRALFETMPLCEIRDKKAVFKQVEEVKSATAVRISAPNLEGVVSGMPLIGFKPEKGLLESAMKDVMNQVESVILDVDGKGVIVRADSLGSVEALLKMLKEEGILVKSASIGNISKKDICEAESNKEAAPFSAVVLGFNVTAQKDVLDYAHQCGVKVITSEVIYKLIEEYKAWYEQLKLEMQQKELDKLVSPCKIRVLPDYVFRQSNPAIFGVEVLAGLLKLDTPMMNKEGKVLSNVKSIQEQQENLPQAESGKRVAISMLKVTIGRQINEGDVLYSAVPERDFKRYKELKHLLSEEQKQVLKEIAEIMRKHQPFWGV